MKISPVQFKFMWMAALIAPVLCSFFLMCVPFLYFNELWQAYNTGLQQLSELSSKGLSMKTMTYDDFLARALRDAFANFPTALIFNYIILAIPAALVFFIYSFIFIKKPSIIVMTVSLTAIVAIIFYVLNMYYFTDTLLASDIYLGKIIGLTLILTTFFTSLIIGLLNKKPAQKAILPA